MSKHGPAPGGAHTAITSLQNERVKLVRSLEMRKVRRETGLFVAEGASLLVTARDAGWSPAMLLYRTGTDAGGVTRDLVAWAAAAGADRLEVSEAVQAKVVSKDNPQTVLGVLRQRWASPPDPRALRPEQTWLALEEVRDPGNLGTIIRTADAAGAAGIILAGTCCDPYASECVRATMGSIFTVPLVPMPQHAFRDLARGWPGDVVATHLEGREDFRTASYAEPALLVMGSEGPGLTAETTAVCRHKVKIPMAGKLDSLNLAVATALALYQIRGRHLKL